MIQAAATLELKNRETQEFRSYVSLANPRFMWFKHCVIIGDVLEKIVSGTIKNAMFFLPPRSGKSELVVRMLAGYYLRKYPTRMVGLASYASDLAHGLSRDARDGFERAEQKVREDVTATREWLTTQGGGMWATGVRGPITGKGFHLGITDDPLKNEVEAYSDRVREGINEWYDATWYTRREPEAAEVLVMTRWHEHDLAGYLLAKEKDEPRNWHIVHLEALKEQGKPNYPATCTVEPDWREVNQALCPERYDERALLTTRNTVGSIFWNALYQQRPTTPEGEIWKRVWFKKLKATQELLQTISDIGFDWDSAYTEKEQNSASAFVKAGRDSQNNVYILDFGFRWVEFPALIRWMSDEVGPHYVEQKASGKSAVQVLKNFGISAKEVKVEGGLDKIGRTKLTTPAAETGHVYVAEHIFDRLLDDSKQGLLKFPNGENDDVNDALVQAINRLYKKRTIHFGWLGNQDEDEESSQN